MSIQYSCSSKGSNAIPFLFKIFFDGNNMINMCTGLLTGTFTAGVTSTTWAPRNTVSFNVEFLILSGYNQVSPYILLPLTFYWCFSNFFLYLQVFVNNYYQFNYTQSTYNYSCIDSIYMALGSSSFCNISSFFMV